MQIPGLNLLNRISGPTTALNDLSQRETRTESLIFTTREEVLENSTTALETHYTSGVDQEYDEENSEENRNEGSKEEGNFEEPAVADPLDIALEAASDHSSAESEIDEEQHSDDAARYNTFVWIPG